MSFFRKPGSSNDVTDDSEEQTYSDSSESETSCGADAENTKDELDPVATPKAKSKSLRKVETLDSTTTSSTTGILSRQLSRTNIQNAGNASQQQETTEWIMRALLEDKCLNDALADLNASVNTTSGEAMYTKDHPNVQELARAKYQYMTDTLSKLNVLPTGPERRDSAARTVQQQARDGLQMLATQAPRPGRPGVMHRDTSLLDVHGGMRDLVTSSAVTRSISSAGLYDQAGLMSSQREAIMGLPPVLRPLIDHPLFEISRYQRDFVEVGMIGKGGYGRVYHVQHRLDGADYAVKKIQLNARRLRRIRERGQKELDALLSEVRVLAKMDHPGIVRYYGGWLEYSRGPAAPIANGVHFRRLLLEAPLKEDEAVAGAQRNANDLSAESIDVLDMFEKDQPRRTSVEIMFERSGGEVLGELDELQEQEDLLAELHQPPHFKQRKRAGSEGTTASTRSKMSSVHSVGPEDITEDEAIYSNDVDAIGGALQLLTTTTDSSQADMPSLADQLPDQHRSRTSSESESLLTLHIQMALHPFSLGDYLTTAAAALSPTPKHCFHLRPSLQILLAIIDGVQYLHDIGVVHRDLKPSNVFLTLAPSARGICVEVGPGCSECSATTRPVQQETDSQNGRQMKYLTTRIGDFGLVTEIARATPESSQSTANDTPLPSTPGKQVGTELYRPPSHASSSHSGPSESLDIYALGIILIELLIPFDTRMERQETLLRARNAEKSDRELVGAMLTERYGKEKGPKLNGLVGAMLDGVLGCKEVRAGLEAMLND